MSNTPIQIGVINEVDLLTQTQVGKILYTETGKNFIIRTDGSKLQFTDLKIVDILPTTGISNILYLLSTDKSINLYNTTTSKWENFGTSQTTLNIILNKIMDITFPITYDKPVFTFICDDGTIESLNRTYPLFTAQGITATFAIVTDWIGSDNSKYMTKDNLKTLVNSGHSLASHSKTHDNTLWNTSVASTTDVQFLAEMNDSKNWFNNNEFGNVETLVYPFANFDSHAGTSGFANRIKALTKQVYTYGVNADGWYNDCPNDQPYLKRYFPDFTSGTTWTEIKNVIDTCIANNGWLIFGIHPYLATQFPDTYINQTIDYIQSLNQTILNFDDALKYKKNILSIGEFTDLNSGYFIGRNGVVRNNAENCKINTNADETITMISPLSSFAKNKMTITAMDGTVDTINHTGGIMTTYYLGSGYGYQQFMGYYGQKEYMRWWSGSAWNTWQETTAMPTPVSTNSYSGVLDSPISWYKQYKITVVNVKTSDDNFKSIGGILKVYHGDVNYSYATFEPLTESNIYKRLWNDTTSTWGTWTTNTSTRIDDTNLSENTTYSSNKIVSLIDNQGDYNTSYIYNGDGKISGYTITGDKAENTSYTYFASGDNIGKIETETIIKDGKTLINTFSYANGKISEIITVTS